jgi:hypothetical protein
MGETPNSYCWSVVIVAFSEVVEFESFFGDGEGEEDRYYSGDLIDWNE